MNELENKVNIIIDPKNRPLGNEYIKNKLLDLIKQEKIAYGEKLIRTIEKESSLDGISYFIELARAKNTGDL